MLIQGFAGINNKKPPTRLKMPDRTDPSCEMVSCTDYDIEDSLSLRVRQGFARVVALSGSHSGYGALGLFIYVRGGVLYSFNPNTLASTVLLNLGSDARVRYFTGAGRIFITNGSVIGKIRNGAASLFSYTPAPFKGALPAGQALCHYKARLWVAQGSTVWISDVKPYSRVDLRYGFKQFPERVVTLAPTTDGIYVGTERSIYFLGGANPLKMTLTKVTNYGAIDAPVWFKDGVEGINAEGVLPVFLTTDGVCAGAPGGALVNLTETKYRPAAGAEGATLLRDNAYDQTHFIGVMR